MYFNSSSLATKYIRFSSEMLSETKGIYTFTIVQNTYEFTFKNSLFNDTLQLVKNFRKC